MVVCRAAVNAHMSVSRLTSSWRFSCLASCSSDFSRPIAANSALCSAANLDLAPSACSALIADVSPEAHPAPAAMTLEDYVYAGLLPTATIHVRPCLVSRAVGHAAQRRRIAACAFFHAEVGDIFSASSDAGPSLAQTLGTACATAEPSLPCSLCAIATAPY